MANTKGKGLAEGATSLKQKEIQRKHTISGSNKSISSDVSIQQCADPNKGRMNEVLSSTCVALADSYQGHSE